MPETDNEKDKLIFIARLDENKKIRVELKTNNLMALSHAEKILGLLIDNEYIGQLMQKPKIVKVSQGGLQSLRKFLDKKN